MRCLHCSEIHSIAGKTFLTPTFIIQLYFLLLVLLLLLSNYYYIYTLIDILIHITYIAMLEKFGHMPRFNTHSLIWHLVTLCPTILKLYAANFLYCFGFNSNLFWIMYLPVKDIPTSKG